MPVKWTRTLVKIGGSWRLTIPKEVIDSQGWNLGELLTITVTDGQVLISRENAPRGTKRVKR
jgi:bifunctional DNA-binding transcriptional regulator/antitoxin component of YhaV-PrlF toxin-antitoxin module